MRKTKRAIDVRFVGVEVKNAFELYVLEINKKDVLLEIRIGDDKPESYRMTTEDEFHAHLKVTADNKHFFG
jgi:hypothetical protein